MLDFPDSPHVNDTYTAPNGAVWVWDGAKWKGALAMGSAYAIVTDLTVSPPNVNAPQINPPMGLLVADTSVPDYTPQGFLPIAGGTLTGNLTVNSNAISIVPPAGLAPVLVLNKPASGLAAAIQGQMAGANRWTMQLGNATAESAGAGSDFVINRFNDAGTFIDAPLSIVRSSAQVNLSGQLTFQGFAFAQGAAGTTRGYWIYTGNSPRWALYANAAAEGGSNAGSDLTIERHADNGAFLDVCFIITRSTGQVAIKGTSTNDNAAAGMVGEVISSVVASPGVTLTTGAAANVTSISLTAGDWDVRGEVWFSIGTGGATAAHAGINSASATIPPAPAVGVSRMTQNVTLTASAGAMLPLKAARFQLTATTPVYLIALANFPSGTTTAYGVIWARRMR